jgi:hypothetical protein
VQVEFTAITHAADAIAALGRTEDVKFSPNNFRLAVLSYLRNSISVFELSIEASLGEKPIALTDVLEISSPYLKNPHGVDFIDDETIMVANRGGDACIFRLPPSGSADAELLPIEIIRSGEVIHTPGSVSITRNGERHCEALLCNNYTNKITSHRIDLAKNCAIERSEVLLEKWLDIPDGVSVNGAWIAISNHKSHSVLLYDRSSELNKESDPVGILRCVYYPHGLRFTHDGRFILVADAGAPYVHIYGKGTSDWRGVHHPLKSLKTLTNEEFLQGRTNIEEGGPKGLDVDNSSRILVTTCETCPLAFFNLAEILERLSQHRTNDALDIPEAGGERRLQRDVEMEYELYVHSKLGSG